MSITDSIQCACSDTTLHRTLAQLRTALLNSLGMADPLGSAVTATLLQLRTDLVYRLGLGAQAASLPPGMQGLLDSIINEAEQTLWRRLELDKGSATPPTRMSADGNTCTLDRTLIFNYALGLAKAHYGAPDAKIYIDTNEKALQDYIARNPPNVSDFLTTLLQDAQRQLYMRYNALRTERWFSWPLTVDVVKYDLDDNDEQNAPQSCTKLLDPRKITWVGLERDGVWTPLVEGIPPELFSDDTSGYPQRYEIRQCIQIWPAPDATEGNLVIKGHFGLEAFAADGDKTTIDDQLVYLLALSNAQAHYGKLPQSQRTTGQLEVMLLDIVAGNHGTARYVPGRDHRADGVYVQPAPSVPFS